MEIAENYSRIWTNFHTVYIYFVSSILIFRYKFVEQFYYSFFYGAQVENVDGVDPTAVPDDSQAEDKLFLLCTTSITQKAKVLCITDDSISYKQSGSFGVTIIFLLFMHSIQYLLTTAYTLDRPNTIFERVFFTISFLLKGKKDGLFYLLEPHPTPLTCGYRYGKSLKIGKSIEKY